MPGSPATPDHPLPRRIGYFLTGILLGLAGGFANGLLVANTQQIQGAFGLSSVETGWLVAAYSMTNVCTSMLLVKFRQRFGVTLFARIFLPAFGLVCLLQMFFESYHLELLLRGIGGIVGSGLTSFALFYFMQSLPPAKRLAGMVLGIGMGQLALPLARVLSPLLLAQGDIHFLFAFELGLALLCLAAAGLLPLPPSETIDTFEALDLLTFAFLAPGVGLLCGVLSLGRTVWWTTPWIGYAVAASIVLIGIATLIEHNRANPLLNLRWMASPRIVMFAVLAASMRVLFTEQGYGSVGLLTALGLGPDQLVTFNAVITLASLAGLVIGTLTLNPTRVLETLMIAVALIGLAGWMDADASNLTRPPQLYRRRP